MKTAKVLPEVTRPRDKAVTEMGVGETGYVTIMDIAVDSDRGCYIGRHACLFPPGDNLTVQITRGEDGFHMIVRDDTELRPSGDPAIYDNDEWLPVASVTLEKTSK